VRGEGYGYEYEARYFGGPADGLDSTVVILDSDLPPRVSYLELYNLPEGKMPIGKHLLKQRPRSDSRVGVYGLEGDPSDYDHDEDVLIYHFIETTTYKEYAARFGES